MLTNDTTLWLVFQTSSLFLVYLLVMHEFLNACINLRDMKKVLF
jgi:hypothetical protein